MAIACLLRKAGFHFFAACSRTLFMMLWIIFAALTGGCALLLLSQLVPAGPVARVVDTGQLDTDVALYTAQLAEIDRDTARGLASADEAEGLKAEAGRRLLRARDAAHGNISDEGKVHLRRRWGAVLIMVMVPFGALGVYALHGNPALPGRPLAARLSNDPAQIDVAMALSRIEAHLAANPNDGRGWAIVAPIYLRTGRHDDAVRAYTALVRADGPSADVLADLGEARVLAANGVVGTEARLVFEESLKFEPSLPKARFFMAIASEQEGNKAKAVLMLQALLADAAADAPWRSAVMERLEALGGSPRIDAAPKGGEAIAALPEAERNAAIAGMVDGLAARLNDGGGTVEEWLRLIRAQAVLGRVADARVSLALARQRLQAQASALVALSRVAQDLALERTP
jgi:cytochrome c-type biogenesis protein CcmH